MGRDLLSRLMQGTQVILLKTRLPGGEHSIPGGVAIWGVLGSLSAVLPELRDHQSALATAFEKVVSGRHPERRGNGLKFVRDVINANARRGLVAASGSGCLTLGGLGETLLELRSWPVEQDRGTLVVLHWRFE